VKAINNYITLLLVLSLFASSVQAQSNNKKRLKSQNSAALTIDQKVEQLLKKMTLQEKAGQLSLNVGDLFNTGPTVQTKHSNKFDDLIRQGKITGIFNTHSAKYLGRLQKIAMTESRLKIPLLFGADVIHGFRTILPIPLAEAASWDMQAVKRSAQIAAAEATAVGINFNFAPMVDITRDPRWGRMAEGAGEDPYLGSLVAAARVKGFQGDDLSAPNTLAACVKHFAAYGAPHGGRDYNTVDMSERMLREIYLPPYKAAVDAGVATLMTSFNELNGTPATGSNFLLNKILRDEWGFQGMVVSDWQSIMEMKRHGVGGTDAAVTKMAIEAGTDMDMEANLYRDVLPNLIKKGKVDTQVLDKAVKRVLKLKYKLGLFDDPYKYTNVAREKKEILSKENLAGALDIAKRCIVLLKNQNELLPLKKDIASIALIGPLANNKQELNGTWSFFAHPDEPVSILEGIKQKVSKKTKIYVAQGCEFYSEKKDKFEAAIAAAKKAEVVVMTLGESAVMNGEAASRANIGLPGIQLDLLKAINATGKPIVLLLTSGRALCLSWEDKNIPAILETWTLGTQTGNAVAEVLFGDYNPSGKLPITFPRHVGQVPIYYNYKNTGRMYEGNYQEHLSKRIYQSKYRDVKNSPLYPFGYGLSYTTFAYGEVALSQKQMKMNETLKVTVEVKNTGKRAGEEVVQLYIRDLVGSVTRPVKELKGFKKIMLKAGESQKVTFELTKKDFSFWRKDMSFGAEAGKFKIFVGTSSAKLKEADFELK
jgi:beta-glucosidase